MLTYTTKLIECVINMHSIQIEEVILFLPIDFLFIYLLLIARSYSKSFEYFIFKHNH